MSEEYKVITTADGSRSIYIPSLDEHYHSGHGALQESLHVYIRSGLDPLLSERASISIFELGFGTGLNALLTAKRAEEMSISVRYHSIEKFPLSTELHRDLNYTSMKGLEGSDKLYEDIVDASWNEEVIISNYFSLTKIQGDIFKVDLPAESYDLIYFDAFGARAQEEMWGEKVFEIMERIMRKEGVLVTYASKGSARRAMINTGLSVEKIPGAPGKREMMRAKK